MSAIYVEVISARGSVPRDAGTAMKVTARGTEGTIGGGALEHLAITRARDILTSNAAEETQTMPLGPSLGQCCGGAVTLHYSRTPRPVDAPARHTHAPLRNPAQPKDLWIWGAGHVGRAMVNACHPQVFKITWVDDHPDRYPDHVRQGVTVTPARDMPRLAARAPAHAHHLIFTYAHDIDLALCAALLKRGFASCGLIGSATKWARFQKRLTAAGLDPAPITCPIGDKSRGKRPDDIAAGTIDALMNQIKAAA
ncbi:xanthine dehydrogenase accessory protein XdhC [Roseobacter sp. S98]|uniref:xanthine dehydrogenase accessory protein XdhC n=1 Tax=Roseobacter algicola (ex Choi et al. 2025) (nom. illeg.) TaxID=3092138 RepID=UPI0035C6979A